MERILKNKIMKKLIIGLITIVAIGFNITVSAQSNYFEFRNTDRYAESIIRILVLDDENSRPMKGATIKLVSNSNRIFEIKTDYNGIAVIVIREVELGYNNNSENESGILSVRDKDYKYTSWERNFDLWDYAKSVARKQFIIKDSEGDIDVWDFGKPSSYEIYKKITNEDYKSNGKGDPAYSFNGREYGPAFGTPGYFEINIRLKYQRHSSEKGRKGKSSEK